MAGKNFSLSSLVPEPMTFTDTDGTEYDVLTTKLLGASDFARINRLQQRLPSALDTLTSLSGEEDGDAEIQAARQVESHLNDFVKLLVPKLPMEKIETYPFGYKAAFLEWWKNEQAAPVEGDSGEVQAGEQNQGRLSPA